MKRIPLRTWLLFISSLVFITAFSQNDFRKGFIVKNNYDTIFGFIDYTTPGISSEHCYFRKDSSDKIINYSPKEIRGYSIEDLKKYVTKEVNIWDSTRLLFLEYVVDGTYDLYLYWESKEVYYFIEKDNMLYALSNNEVIYYGDNGSPHLRNSGKYKGTLNYLIGDRGKWSNKIENAEFTQASLSDLIKDYDKEVCKDQNCIVYYKKTKVNDSKFQIRLGIITNTSISRLGFKFTNNARIYRGLSGKNFPTYDITSSNLTSGLQSFLFSPGIFININKNGRTSFQSELEYQNINYSGINLKKLEVPIFFTYDFNHHSNIKPYLKAGIDFNKFLELKIKKTYFINYNELTRLVLYGSEAFVYNTEYTPRRYELKDSDFINENSIGLIAGAGIKIGLKKSQFEFGLDFIYTGINKKVSVFDEHIIMNYVKFLAGYSIRLK